MFATGSNDTWGSQRDCSGVLVLPTRVSSSPRLAVCGFVVLNVLLFQKLHHISVHSSALRVQAASEFSKENCCLSPRSFIPRLNCCTILLKRLGGNGIDGDKKKGFIFLVFTWCNQHNCVIKNTGFFFQHLWFDFCQTLVSHNVPLPQDVAVSSFLLWFPCVVSFCLSLWSVSCGRSTSNTVCRITCKSSPTTCKLVLDPYWSNEQTPFNVHCGFCWLRIESP